MTKGVVFYRTKIDQDIYNFCMMINFMDQIEKKTEKNQRFIY